MAKKRKTKTKSAAKKGAKKTKRRDTPPATGRKTARQRYFGG